MEYTCLIKLILLATLIVGIIENQVCKYIITQFNFLIFYRRLWSYNWDSFGELLLKCKYKSKWKS
jgi:hypothetical protein